MNCKDAYIHVEKIQSNTSELYSFLRNLYLEEKLKDRDCLIRIYEKAMLDQRIRIQIAGVWGLLFAMRIKNDYYKKHALEILKDIDRNWELRMWIPSCLAQAYYNTRDLELLKTFYYYYNNDLEEEVRVNCFAAMMMILGLSSKTIIDINRGVIFEQEDIKQDLFRKEITKINELIGNVSE